MEEQASSKTKVLKLVKQIDGYKCFDCGRSDLLLNVHHIDNSQKNGDWEMANNSLKNLVSLCSFCHIKRHNKAKGNKPLFDNREKIIKMYYEGKTMRDIAKVFSVSHQRVQQLFIKWGVRVRNGGVYSEVKSKSKKAGYSKSHKFSFYVDRDMFNYLTSMSKTSGISISAYVRGLMIKDKLK